MDRRGHLPLERFGEDTREAYARVPEGAIRVLRTPQIVVMIPSVPRVVPLCGTPEADVEQVRPHGRLEHQEASGQA